MQLALTPDGRWGYPTAELVSAAGGAGFTAVGINADRVDAAAVEAYAAAGVGCHELLAFVVSDDESATMASAEQLADRAQAVDAEWVLTVFTAKVPAQHIQRCAKIFDGVGAQRRNSSQRGEFHRHAGHFKSRKPVRRGGVVEAFD